MAATTALKNKNNIAKKCRFGKLFSVIFVDLKADTSTGSKNRQLNASERKPRKRGEEFVDFKAEKDFQ